MGTFTGIISAGMKTLFNDAIDALLETSALTVPCQLIFEDTQFSECPNCYFDVTSDRSANIYKAGGPIVFNQGICPYCGGIGKITEDNTININLAVLWNYKDWIGVNYKLLDNINIPFGYAQLLTKVENVTNIKRAKEIILNTSLSTYTKHRFIVIAEPNPLGFGNDSYITVMLKRIG